MPESPRAPIEAGVTGMLSESVASGFASAIRVGGLPAAGGVTGASEIVPSSCSGATRVVGFAGGFGVGGFGVVTRVSGFAGVAGVVGLTGASGMVTSEGGVVTRGVGFGGGGGVGDRFTGASEIVAPSSSNGVFPGALSPFAGTPTPRVFRPPFLEFGSSIKHSIPRSSAQAIFHSFARTAVSPIISICFGKRS